MKTTMLTLGWLNITLAAFTGAPLGGLGYYVGFGCVALAAALSVAGFVRDVRAASRAK
jgi:hypothetical protein